MGVVIAPRLMAMGCLPCVSCARMPRLSFDTYMCWPDIHCPGCYDGAPDAKSPYATAAELTDAIDWWNERMRDRVEDLSYVPPKELCGYYWCESEHDHGEGAR